VCKAAQLARKPSQEKAFMATVKMHVSACKKARKKKKAMRSFTEEDTSRLAREDEPPVSFVFGWMVLVAGADFL